MWSPRNWFQPQRPLTDEQFARMREELLSKAPVPVLGLLGKTGSGKTSVVRYLTGATEAEIGNGFRPQTRTSSLYSFPAEATPLLKFLDTRGLGEAGYDATADLQEFTARTHLLIVTVRAMDHALSHVIDPLRIIRHNNPQLPVIVLQTCLHAAYPGEQHPSPDPFEAHGHAVSRSIPENLSRSLQAQRALFSDLANRFVPIDLTPEEEGFLDADYGGERLKQSILDELPDAYREALSRLAATRDALRDLYDQKTWPVILSYSTLAATAAAVPVPWIDMPVVLALQTRMIYRIADIHGQSIDAWTIASVSGSLGVRMAVRMALREVMKVIPWAGSALNAAAAFALTFATGKSWTWYFSQLKQGHIPTSEELKNIFEKELKNAATLWRSGNSKSSSE